MKNIRREDSFCFWDINNAVAPDPMTTRAAESTQTANSAVKKETNLQHRKKVLAELAKQGVIPIKQKRRKRLERYFCFYKNNSVQHDGDIKPASLTPACSKDDVTEKYSESVRI